MKTKNNKFAKLQLYGIKIIRHSINYQSSKCVSCLDDRYKTFALFF